MSTTREELEVDLDDVLDKHGNLSLVYSHSVLDHLLEKAQQDYHAAREAFLAKWTQKATHEQK